MFESVRIDTICANEHEIVVEISGGARCNFEGFIAARG